MNPVFRGLLLRYQNYILEFYQLIEDKELVTPENALAAKNIKKFLENIPELDSAFELSFSFSKIAGEFTSVWEADISNEGFSIRSYSVEDEFDEREEWYFHYYDATEEYEGNLFNDGDWDLFLEEVAEVDAYDGGELQATLTYTLGEKLTY